MVTRLLRLSDPPRPADTADALALAICHLWRGGAQRRLADGRRAGRRRPAARPRPRSDRRIAMISHLDGTVAAVAPDGAVIEVGGVGLLVQCTPGTLAGLRPGERARVATSLVVREDALTLYGFAADDERDMFELLQTASGVGPRLALAMLAVFTPDALRRAVAAEDLTALTRVPGIGRKGAQRIVLELAGRLGSPGDGGGPAGRRPRPGRAAGAEPWRDQVRAGLVNLGWQAARGGPGDRRGRADGAGRRRTATDAPQDVDVAVALRGRAAGAGPAVTGRRRPEARRTRAEDRLSTGAVVARWPTPTSG